MATAQIINLVQQKLESEGQLDQIRAQIRASVIRAFQDGTPHVNTKISKFKETNKDGYILLEIVADLLQVLDLKSSLSVFQAECHLQRQLSREDLMEKLNIHVDASSSVLQCLVESGRSFNPDNISNAAQEKHKINVTSISINNQSKAYSSNNQDSKRSSVYEEDEDISNIPTPKSSITNFSKYTNKYNNTEENKSVSQSNTSSSESKNKNNDFDDSGNEDNNILEEISSEAEDVEEDDYESIKQSQSFLLEEDVDQSNKVNDKYMEVDNPQVNNFYSSKSNSLDAGLANNKDKNKNDSKSPNSSNKYENDNYYESKREARGSFDSEEDSNHDEDDTNSPLRQSSDRPETYENDSPLYEIENLDDEEDDRRASNKKDSLPPLNQGRGSPKLTINSEFKYGNERDILTPNEESDSFEVTNSIHDDLDNSTNNILNSSRRSNQEEDEEEERRLRESEERLALKKDNNYYNNTASRKRAESDENNDYDDDFENDEVVSDVAESLEEDISYGANSDENSSFGDLDTQDALGINKESSMTRTTSGMLKPVLISARESKRGDDDEDEDEESENESDAAHREEQARRLLDIDKKLAEMDSKSEEEEGARGMPSRAPVALAYNATSTILSASSSRFTNATTKPAPKSDFDDYDFGDEGPETQSNYDSVTSDSIDDGELSVGGASEGMSFFDEDESRGVGGSKAGHSDFSVSDHEISGSHGLDGYDYTTNAMPPSNRRGMY